MHWLRFGPGLRRSTWLVRVAALGLALAVAASTFAAPAAPPTDSAHGPSTPDAGRCAELLAEASRWAGEQSWSRARDVFAAALPLAADAEAKRWCELGLAAASWRSEAEPSDWPLRHAWQAKHRAKLDQLVAAADASGARDAFWIATLEARSEFFTAHHFTAEAEGDWSRLARHFADQPVGDAAARGLVKMLRLLVPRRAYYRREQPDRASLLPMLEAGVAHGADASDRAWCAWRVADFDREVTAARLAQWRRALALSHDTSLAPLVAASEFLWRTNAGWNPEAKPGAASDFPALLAEAARLRAALATATPTDTAAELAKELQGLEENWSAPQLSLYAPSQLLPGETVQFAYGAAGLDEVEFTVLRQSPEAWAQWALDARKPITASAGTVLRRWKVPVGPATSLRWQSEVFGPGVKLGPGPYTIVARGLGAGVKPEPTQFWSFTVSAYSGQLAAGPVGDFALFLTKADSAEVLAGAKVTVALNGPYGPGAWSGTTNREGRLELPAAAWLKGAASAPLLGSDSASLVASVGGNPVALSFNLDRLSVEPRLQADLIFDRPLYRPGETVHWKAILRERRAEAWSLPTGNFTLALTLGEEPLLPATALALNRFGTAHGEFVVPLTAHPDVAVAVIGSGDGQTFVVAESLFRVDNFVPPATKARIELGSAPDSLRPGETVSVRVAAEYLSGGPMVGAPVELQVLARESGGAKLEKAERERLERWLTELKTHPQAGVTDREGRAEFSVNFPAELPGGLRLELRATVRPEGGVAVAESESWALSRSGVRFDPSTEPDYRLVRPGDDVEFTGLVLGGTGKPVAFAGAVQLVERRWVAAFLGPKGEIVDTAGLPAELRSFGAYAGETEIGEWKRLHAGWSDTVLESVVVETGVDGKVVAKFKLPHAGVYRAQLAGPRGVAETKGEKHVIAADARTIELKVPPTTERVIFPAKLTRGPSARGLVILPLAEDAALVELQWNGGQAIRRVPLRSGFGWVDLSDLPVGVDHGTATLVDRTGWGLEDPSEFRFAEANPAPRLVLTPDRDAIRPGEAGTLKLEARDAAGKPWTAEIALAVADEAVNSLVSEPTERPPVWNTTERPSTARIYSSARWEKWRASPLRDPRRGAVVLVSGGGQDGEDVVKLDEFSVEISREGTFADIASMSGTRVRGAFRELSYADYKDGSLGIVAMGDVAELARPAPEDVIGRAGSAPPIRIRTHFGSTAFWAPEVVTDAQGVARVEFKYPDNLTQWRVSAYAVGADGNTFAKAHTFTRASLPFQARLQLPRSLVAGDTAQPSALLVNRTASVLTATAALQIAGPVTAESPSTPRDVVVPPQGEGRAAWTIKAAAPGEATFTLAARAGSEADAMRLPLTVAEDGLLQKTGVTGRLAPESAKLALTLALPAVLEPTRTTARVQLSTSHAAAMLDALPYLVDYPYGCVEQTMNRFLPAVIVRKTLTELGVDPAAVETRLFGRETASDAKRRAATAGLGKLDEVIAKSVARLREAQRPGEGDFGWWPEARQRDDWMTAYVGWGLALARDAKVAVPEPMLESLSEGLDQIVADASADADHRVWALAALARLESKVADDNVAACRTLFDAREKLAPSGRAVLALAAARFGTAEQRAILLRNLESGANRVRRADLGDTVHWGKSTDYWEARDGAIESTALTVLALAALDPRHELLEPAVNWLVLERRSANWRSTRDSAFAVLALAEYLRTKGGMDGVAEVEVFANGSLVRRVTLDRTALLAGPTIVDVPLAALRSGDNAIEVRRAAGGAPVYATALAEAWASGEAVKPAGNLAEVARGFERKKAIPTLRGTPRFESERLADDGVAAAGEPVTARVRITVPNELEYVMVAVPKPAGCEPANPLSGWDARLVAVTETKSPLPGSSAAATEPAVPSDDDGEIGGRAVYREEHDARSVFFLDHLEAGTWEIVFELCAVTPGDFRALPVEVEAMYVPEIRANSDARRLRIAPAK